MRLKILLIGLTTSAVLIWPKSLRAQKDNLHFERISLEHGLSQNTIYCILQDHKGFLWIGTQDGLNKYDGYDFKVYKHDPEARSSLSSSVITSIYEDHSNVLWIGTNSGGLNKFDREKETFTHYQNDPKDPKSLSGNYVSSIYEDRSGGLWIGIRDGGLNKLVWSDGHPTFSQYRNDPDDPNSLSHNYVSTMCEDQSGSLWIATYGGGLNMLVRGENASTPARFVQYKNAPHDSRSLSDNFLTSLYQDSASRNTLWIGTRNGLNKLVLNKDDGTPTFIHYGKDPNDPKNLSHNSIWSIYADQNSAFWIGTAAGLNKFIPSENDGAIAAFIHYENDPNVAGTLSDNNIRTIYEDRSGILWIGTWNGGLNKLARKQKTFVHFEHSANNLQSLSHNNVRAIYADSRGGGSVLWIGTRGGGLNRLDRKRETFKQYRFAANNPKSLSHDYVWSIFEDRAGTLWIGTYGGGLNKFDRAKETPTGVAFTHYAYTPDNPDDLSHKNVTPIYEDRTGMLWIGTDGGGLNLFDREKEIFKHYKHDANDPNSLSHNGVWSIYEDREDMLWIGTSGGGLNKFDRATERFTHYKNDPNDPESLSNNYVFSIYEDSHNGGMLWLGTWGGGLNRFDRQTGEFVRFREKDGLPNEVVYGILEDDHGNLWLSTNKGIARFNPQTGIFKNYNVLDGLQSNEFNAGAYHKSPAPRDEMFFGGINGFNAFHPDSVKDNHYIPPLVITAFKKFDETIAGDISAAGEFELPYKDKYLTFEFVALDYTHPEKNQYAFMLEGFNNDWIYSGTRRFASYTNLDPGTYVFKVKGSNNDGVWNEQGLAVKITITPPLWKTWWAYALYVLITASLLYGVRRYELNRLRLKNQLQLEHVQAEKFKELDHLKSRFFANISHEFRTPLTLILGPLEQVSTKIADLGLKHQLHTAFNNGRRLLRLINQLLDLSKLEAGGMELKTSRGNLIAFLKGIVFTFESAAQQKQITLEFQSVYDHLVAYYDVGKLEQVFYNLMANAIKFIPPNAGGKISVKAVKSQASLLEKLPPNVECVRITFRDNGIGIPSELLPRIFGRFYRVERSRALDQEGTGLGLALAKEMVELHYGQISVSSEEGKGSAFIVTLPLGNAHLKPEEIVEDVGSEQLPVSSEQLLVVSDQLPATSIKDQASSKEIILLVEDNHDVRAFIRQQLEADYEVIEAVDGEEGFAKATETIPDLVISDVMMPKMDGYAFCQALKSEEKTSHIPLIMLTAKAGQESKLEGLETGVDDYLTKPFSSKELLVRVRNLIEQRRRLRARFSREVILKPNEIAITPPDEQFLTRVKAAVEKNLGDEDFSVEDLVQEVGMSRTQLHRKLKALTDQSAGQFILSMRLQRAIELMKQNAGTVAEIAYMVGFNTPNYFAKCFRKQFGCSPSEYKMNISQEAS